MNFFQKLHALNAANIEIKIVAKDDKLTVSVLPKSKNKIEGLENIPPLVITGTPQELDAGFFDVIEKPVQKSLGIIFDVEAHEKALKEAALKKEEAAKAKKETGAKTPAKAKETKETAPKPEKPQPPSKFQKYIDAIVDFTKGEDFKITAENKAELKQKVWMLLAMEKDNKIGLEWDARIKAFEKEGNDLFASTIEEEEEEQPKACYSPEVPRPPCDDFDEEDDHIGDYDDDDLGGTGHGDISYSDADPGL